MACSHQILGYSDLMAFSLRLCHWCGSLVDAEPAACPASVAKSEQPDDQESQPPAAGSREADDGPQGLAGGSAAKMEVDGEAVPAVHEASPTAQPQQAAGEQRSPPRKGAPPGHAQLAAALVRCAILCCLVGRPSAPCPDSCIYSSLHGCADATRPYPAAAGNCPQGSRPSIAPLPCHTDPLHSRTLASMLSWCRSAG